MSEDRMINYFESWRKDYDAYQGSHRREESLAMRDTAVYQKKMETGIIYLCGVTTAILGVLLFS
jgi:hypothetical protein